MESASPLAGQDYRKVPVPYDGSEGATKALRRALMMGKRLDLGVTVISVDERLPRYAKGVGEVAEEPEIRAEFFSSLKARAEAVAADENAKMDFTSAVGHAAQEILRVAAERRFDLLVIGHSGHSGLWGGLLGSTTARVVDQAGCDVLVVR